MSKPLIIVESPAKTRTLKNFLGGSYRVEASMGHVRDLPKNDLGVDIDRDFRPKYLPIPERKEVLKKLKQAAGEASEVFLASDPDREGEAIAWHLQEALKLAAPKRIEFNEITRTAVEQALASPRAIDMDRVNAQQARRVLDRLVGYKLSPLLWSKVKKNLSAGRVQSVAVRLICDREREIQAFVPVEYWTIVARLTPFDVLHPFEAKLIQKNGEKIEIPNEEQAFSIVRDLDGASYRVTKVSRKEKKRNPAPPFTTSTLQQEASRKLGFSNKRTMVIAQQLYEGVELGEEGSIGLITYMRTDSTRVAAEAQAEARNLIRETFGPDFLPAAPRQFAKKGAQDAHEAIRPTSVFRRPEDVERYLDKDQAKLYKLIWQRFVASQMAAAIYDVVTVDIGARDYTFRATGSTIKFTGFTSVYMESRDDAGIEDEDRPPLPMLAEGQEVRLIELVPSQHFTEPPPRYTEATLVKALEENGIGRPSTYAIIISTIQDRGYVVLREKKFYPTELGFVVTDFLVKHFPKILDVGFTASVENHLDDIERGSLEWIRLLHDFYSPFEEDLARAQWGPEGKDRKCPNCGRDMVVKTGRYGEFLGCTGYPECKTIVRMEREKTPLLEPKESDQVCPECGRKMLIREGRTGQFLGCSGYPECKKTMPVENKVGMTCPVCGQGEIIEKISRKKKTFYGCNRYPECGFVTWDKPVDRRCPTCESIMTEWRYRGRLYGYRCSNRKCNYKERASQVEEAEIPPDESAQALAS